MEVSVFLFKWITITAEPVVERVELVKFAREALAARVFHRRECAHTNHFGYLLILESYFSAFFDGFRIIIVANSSTLVMQMTTSAALRGF